MPWNRRQKEGSRRSMGSDTDAERVLRDKLKVALQDAKNLFDDDLLDEKEFKDLKAHEIGKYKEQLAALTANLNPSPSPTNTASPQSDRQRAVNGTSLRTPDKARLRQPLSRPFTTSLGTPPSITRPQSSRKKGQKEEVLYLDANAYNRLATPPIFRRRSNNKRKIRLPCAELKALQESRGEKTNMG